MASEEAGMETRSDARARERIRAVMSSPVSAAMIRTRSPCGDASRDVVEGDEASFALLVELPVAVPDDFPEAMVHRWEKITHRVIPVKRDLSLARRARRVGPGRYEVSRPRSADAARSGPGLTSAV